MNISKTYEFKVKIAKEKLKAMKKVKDILTGEQREQVQSEMEVVKELPIEVELYMPGCIVSPQTQYVSPDVDSAVISFFITPIAKYKKLQAKLTLGQRKLTKKEILLEVSVIDNRIVKILSLIGVVIAFIPSLWPFLFQTNLNDNLLTALQEYIPALASPHILGLELGLGGLFLIFAGIFWKFYGATRAQFNSTTSI